LLRTQDDSAVAVAFSWKEYNRLKQLGSNRLKRNRRRRSDRCWNSRSGQRKRDAPTM